MHTRIPPAPGVLEVHCDTEYNEIKKIQIFGVWDPIPRFGKIWAQKQFSCHMNSNTNAAIVPKGLLEAYCSTNYNQIEKIKRKFLKLQFHRLYFF